MRDPVSFSWRPEFRAPVVVVGWSIDAGDLGNRVTRYLIQKLGGASFCSLDPAEFFSMGGIIIEEDVVQFPQSEFFGFPEYDLVVLQSAPPTQEWYRFLNVTLDVAQNHCHARELYTVGGMISPRAHTTPRELAGVFNSLDLRDSLAVYPVSRDMDYETPPGQLPTLSSFLLWTARRRNLPGASLWVPIPFYLLAWDDAAAQKRVLEFLDQRLALHLDFGELDNRIREENDRLAQARQQSPELDGYITRLESNQPLTQEESEKLVKGIQEYLSRKTR